MPRIERVVVPGYPHHVTQRGVRRMDVFFSETDRRDYLTFISRKGREHGVDYLAWCLMANHVHLVAIPATEGSLAKGIGEAHKRYTRMINARYGWKGYLFQGRFFSCPVEPSWLLSVVRYVLRNPVRAGVARTPWEYHWSSARWMVGDSTSDPLVTDIGPLVEVPDWRAFLQTHEFDRSRIRKHTQTGRPMGGQAFTRHVERMLGRILDKKRQGSPPDHRGHIP